VLGDIALTRSEQTLSLQSSQRFKACPTDLDDTICGLHFPTPATDSQVQADPSLKEKAWHLTWMLLAFLASLRPQRQPSRFTGEIWEIFFCRVLGALIPLLRAHAQCACQKFVLDQYGDHVLTCKKHTGTIASYDHVLNVSVQLARNSGLRVRINRKVSTTAADGNRQGDVQAMEFGIPEYDDLVLYVSLVSNRIGSSKQHGLNGKLELGDYLIARARIKNNRHKRDYAAKNIAFAPAILSVAGKIHPEFLRFLWVLADMQTVKYFNLVGDEEDIGNERFKWSRASTFSYNRNAIGLAVAYTSAIRTDLSVHGTAHPMSAASVRPRPAADCIIRSAVDISHPRQQGTPPASSSAASGPVRSDIIKGLSAGAVGGAATLRWFLACLQASIPVLLTRLLPLRRRAVVTTCRRKVKHRIIAPLRVPWLIVPPLALTLTPRKPMYARMSPLQTGMPISVRAL